jgi:hypothetical protein
MTGSKKALAVPILIIALGIGWLLTAKNVVPGVNWIWVVGLGVTGALIVAGSFDKVTAVVGPFLIAASTFSIIRQTGHISVETEVPSLVIVLGTFMLLAKILPIPLPAWIVEPPRPRP